VTDRRDTDYRFDRVGTLEDLRALREEWDALAGRVADPGYFHEFDWYFALSSHLLDMDPLVFTCRIDGGLVGVFPLVRYHRAEGVHRYRALTSPRNAHHPLADFVIDRDHVSPKILNALFRHLGREDDLGWDVIELFRTRERSCIVASMDGARRRVARADTDESSFIPCASPEDLAGLSKKQRKNVARLRRKAGDEVGPVEVRGFPGVVGAGVDAFSAVEASGWKGDTSTAIAADPATDGFYREVMESFARRGAARVDVLSIGGRDAAAHMAVRAGAVWYLLKIGHDPDFARYGPGAILLDQFLQEMAETAGVDEVNLVTGPQWAARWHPRTEPVWTVRLYSGSPVGRVRSASRGVVEMVRSGRDFWQRHKRGSGA